jgi:hypothetical protein
VTRCRSLEAIRDLAPCSHTEFGKIRGHDPLSGALIKSADLPILISLGTDKDLSYSTCPSCLVTKVNQTLGLSYGVNLKSRAQKGRRRLVRKDGKGPKYWVIPPTSLKPVRATCRYYRAFRRERKVLEYLLSNPVVIDRSIEDYRSLRYLYYCIVPHLFASLVENSDTCRVVSLMVRLEEELLLWHSSYRRRAAQTSFRKLLVVARYEPCPHTCGPPSDKL